MDIEPAHTQQLHPDDREFQYRETLDFAQAERRLRRRVGMAGWIVGGVGATIGLVSVCSLIVILPLKTTEVRFVEVDTSTGWVGEAAGATDAPKMFSEQVAAHFLRAYVDAREGYVPETDQVRWDAVRAMSSTDEFEGYKAWRKTDVAPVKQFNLSGHVDVFNFNVGKPIKGKNDTFSYVVRFDRREIKGQAVGPIKHWTATVDFQWHPEIVMGAQDRLINPAGMQVISYKSDQE
jgi:type IV secretory pathway component VirB8